MFYKILKISKKLIYIPCITGLLGFFFMLIMATMTLIQAIIALPAIWAVHFDYVLTKSAIAMAIFSIDQYLIAFLFYIFSNGIYSLFLNDEQSMGISKNSVLSIKSLDQLKDILSKTIVLALLIEYFKFAIEMTYDHSIDLLYFSLSILAISLSIVSLFHFSKMKRG
ncbi:MAG: YqhA family protein [Gammaproteobacteria bacterium]|jgi:uncharacterized membrane protein YqhA|nr:YqhA family protein [Gammaproteobacteria bacterium]